MASPGGMVPGWVGTSGGMAPRVDITQVGWHPGWEGVSGGMASPGGTTPQVGWRARRPHELASRVDGISGKMVPRVGWQFGWVGHVGWDGIMLWHFWPGGTSSGIAPRVG